MKIPKAPYHGTANGLLYALLSGGDCVGYEDLEIDDISMPSLNPPENGEYALIVVEADPTTTDKSKVIRIKEFIEDDSFPTSAIGIPLGDFSVYEVKGKKNMQDFRAISIEAGKLHILRVQYYG
jgi:hypothetical protein